MKLKENIRKLMNILFFFAIFGLTFWGIFHDENPNRVLYYLKSANDWYMIPAVICVLFFILGESVIIHYLMKELGAAVKFSHCALYSFIGFFYSAITPSASGGQPMQVMTMRKDGIPMAVSTVVLAIVTITYKLVLVTIGVGILLLQPPRVMHYLDVVDPVVYLGLGLNIVFISMLLMMVFYPAVFRKMADIMFALSGKIRAMKNPEKARERLERIISQYHSTAGFFRKRPGIIFRVFLITFVQRMCLFSVVWFTYRSFGLRGAEPEAMIMLYAMISVAVDMLPLPGGMGISESMFLAIFEPIFGEALVLPGMVICRGISYYTQLAISAVMTALSHFIIRDKRP